MTDKIKQPITQAAYKKLVAPRKTKYIFIEGCDGVGKTYFINHLKDKLEAKGKTVNTVHILKTTTESKRFYKRLVDGKINPLSKRYHMLANIIDNTSSIYLNSKYYDYVLVDRSIISYFAYNTNDRYSVEFKRELALLDNESAYRVYLYLGAKTALERIKRERELDTIESHGIALQKHLHNRYLDYDKIYPEYGFDLKLHNTEIKFNSNMNKVLKLIL